MAGAVWSFACRATLGLRDRSVKLLDATHIDTPDAPAIARRSTHPDYIGPCRRNHGKLCQPEASRYPRKKPRTPCGKSPTRKRFGGEPIQQVMTVLSGSIEQYAGGAGLRSRLEQPKNVVRRATICIHRRNDERLGGMCRAGSSRGAKHF
jgi:hypothetical protein